MAELPLEELLAVENDFERRMLFVSALDRALAPSGTAVTVLEGEAATWLQDRYRATHLFALLTSNMASVAEQLASWGFQRYGDTFVHDWLKLIPHLVELQSERLALNCRANVSARVCEPDGTTQRQVIAQIEEQNDSLGQAITLAVQRHVDLARAAGKIEALGPRRWRYHFGQQKLLEYHERQRES